MKKEFLRKLSLTLAVLAFFLFIGSGAGWLGTQVYRDFFSPKVAHGEFVYPWKSYGSILYVTGRQEYWLHIFDRLSDWCVALGLMTFLGWFGFVALSDP